MSPESFTDTPLLSERFDAALQAEALQRPDSHAMFGER
jgi:hypothetical protein